MKKFRRNSGFTLLEIIIVIAIMGFLVAMIAPRLGGIGQDAQENVDNTNLQRLTDSIGYGVQQNTLLPDKLVSLVVRAGAAGTYTYSLPLKGSVTTSGVLNENFYDDNHLTIHHLSDDEATALRAMGLTTVLILDAAGVPYVEADVAEGVGVAMIGGGAAAAAAVITADAALTAGTFSAPELAYRMVFGINNDSGLVSSGMITTAPVSPASAQNDAYTYGLYNIVFPRLAASVTSARLTGAVTSVDATGDTTLQVKTILLNTAQEAWQYTTLSPEGKHWPESDNASWDTVVTP